jgi:hypothetical protein
MKLNKVAFGLAAGILCGLAVFAVTNYRILSGGVGCSLSNLKLFYFGYSFSFLGSIIGLIWGFVYGFVVAWIFAYLYNLFAKQK